MFTISYQKQGGHEYGTLCTVKREKGKVVKAYGETLGRVIDKDRLIFKSRARGLFQYDRKNNKFLSAPKDVEVPKRKSRMKVPARPVTFTFGDVYMLDKYMQQTHFYGPIEDAYADKADSIKAMICYYILSTLSNQYASDWLATSMGQFLFPKAHIGSTQVSELLKYLGDESRQQLFFFSYLKWFVKRYQGDDLGNILLDSTGLPNSVHFRLTAISNHNGDINNEVRLIYVVQQSTGLPIFFRCVPGNIIDVKTISRTILYLKQLGVDTHFAITDAGYVSEENLEIFYRENISFLSRLQPNRVLYKQIVKEHLPTLKSEGILVKQNQRVIRVKKVPCQLCEHRSKNGEVRQKGHTGYAYLCMDEQRASLEKSHLVTKVAQGTLALEDFDKESDQLGLFVLISKRSIAPDKVVSLYYTRQEIEQVFDFGKNYASMLPLSVQQESTFRGHMVLAFLAGIVVKMLCKDLKSTGYPVKPTLENLKGQTCVKVGDIFVTNEANRHARAAYDALSIEFPAWFPAYS